MSKKITYDEYKDKWDASFDKGKEYKAACNELGESSAKAKKIKIQSQKRHQRRI